MSRLLYWPQTSVDAYPALAYEDLINKPGAIYMDGGLGLLSPQNRCRKD